MATTIDWATGVISVLKADLTLISGDFYSLDTDVFRAELNSLQASEYGMPWPTTNLHTPEVTIAGATYARGIQIINGYTVEFEDGHYSVRLDGSNNNIFDEGILVRNSVSVIPTNSAGLIVGAGGSGTNAARASGTYDGVGQIELTVWLARGDATIATPTSCSVDWRNQDGTLLFNSTSVTPDAQGHFSLSKAQILVADEAYYLVVSVTDSTGTITTSRGAAASGSAVPEAAGGLVYPIYGLQV